MPVSVRGTPTVSRLSPSALKGVQRRRCAPFKDEMNLDGDSEADVRFRGELTTLDTPTLRRGNELFEGFGSI
jgi:hypothetical protein